MTVTMGNIGTADNVIMANVRSDVQPATADAPAHQSSGFGPVGSRLVSPAVPQGAPAPAGLLATGGAGTAPAGPPAGFGPIGAAPVVPAPETPASGAGFGPLVGLPPPAGFGAVRMVSAVELARRYRMQARGLDFEDSDRASRLLQRAKDLERGADLIVPDVEID